MAIIKPATYAKCLCCGHEIRQSDELHGCDMCHRIISYTSNEMRYEISVFTDQDAATHYIFDRLVCAYAWLKRFNAPINFRFLTLPYLSSSKELAWFQKNIKVDELLQADKAKLQLAMKEAGKRKR